MTTLAQVFAPALSCRKRLLEMWGLPGSCCSRLRACRPPPPLDTLPPAAGPVMNLEFLLDFVLDFVKPLDWLAVLDSPIPLKVSLLNPTVSNANSSGTLSRPWTGRRFFKHAFLPQLLQSPTQGCFAGSVCTHLPPGLSSAEILLLSCK